MSGIIEVFKKVATENIKEYLKNPEHSCPFGHRNCYFCGVVFPKSKTQRAPNINFCPENQYNKKYIREKLNKILKQLEG